MNSSTCQTAKQQRKKEAHMQNNNCWTNAVVHIHISPFNVSKNPPITTYKLLSLSLLLAYYFKLEMWANAQRDGRPAKYRWRSLFNTAKFGWRPLLECRAVMLPRRETRWNYLGCPKLMKRSQPLVGRSSPYCEDTWRRYCCLTSFFRLSICALFAKI